MGGTGQCLLGRSDISVFFLLGIGCGFEGIVILKAAFNSSSKALILEQMATRHEENADVWCRGSWIPYNVSRQQ